MIMSLIFKSRTSWIVALVLPAFVFCAVSAGEARHRNLKHCSRIARAACKAAQNEALDDYWIAVGKCFNMADAEERRERLADAWEEYKEARELAKDQREARLELCGAFGEGTYEPEIAPEDFVDFDAVLNEDAAFEPNPYFPLIAGSTWEYLGYDEEGELAEHVFVEVPAETTEILGVNCIVVRDRVWEIDEEDEETLVEDTFDWYGQDLDGNVWYMGEIAKNFEDGELVDLEGSWKAGRDGAYPGIIMLADPQVGDIYRQEFLLGDAEDVAEVLAIGEDVVEVPFDTYSEDVLRTADWTPIEPDVIEHKHYAPGVGMALEIKPGTDERVELIDYFTP